MVQAVKIYVADDFDAAIDAATVTLHDTITGQSLFQLTDVDGMALFGSISEGRHTAAVTKQDWLAPAPIKIEVGVPPVATAAYLNPPAAAAYASVDAALKNIKLIVDNDPTPVLIDVSGGDDIVISPAELITNINAALAAENIAWAAVASDTLGEVRLTSPTTGASSAISIVSDGSFANDATELVFGLATGFGTLTVTGDDAPLDYNDWDLEMTAVAEFTSLLPYACVLWGRFWRHELANEQTPAALSGRTVWIEIVNRPKTTPLGIDVGDSFYVTTDENGYLHFELIRGTVARMYLSWLDKYIDFTVPDAASANLDALLSPYITGLTITTPVAPVGVVVGSTCGTTTAAAMSDGSVGAPPANMVLTSSDPAVLLVDGTNITGVSVGSAELTASVVNAKNVLIESEALPVEVSA